MVDSRLDYTPGAGKGKQKEPEETGSERTIEQAKPA
jgi:hypothetical protein